MLDYRIYQDCFSSAAMRDTWSEQTTLATWLKVEQVLSHCQADAGLIPLTVSESLGRLTIDDLDQERLHQDMMLVGRPIVGLVKQLRELMGEQAPYVHYHSTTQDIMDTALAIQMKQGLDDIKLSIARIVASIKRHIEAHQTTLLIGRTNGQHALPITLAQKLELWHNELIRRQQAITEAAQRGLNVQVAGSVGNLHQYQGDSGQIVKQAMANKLGLGTTPLHWQNARDGLADIVMALGGLCASLCKISHNINLLASSDVGELSEAYTDGQGASSSMPHKKNQRISEFGEAVARLGRQRSEQIGELILHEHERSGGMWIAEWLVVPEAFLLTSGALAWLEKMFENLIVHEDVMSLTVQKATGANA